MEKNKGKLLMRLLIGGMVIFVSLSLTFYLKYKNMISTLHTTPFTSLNLNNINDGVYEGSFSKFLCSAKVRVTIKSHKIHSIEILEQKANKKYTAADIVGRVIAAQSLKVDSVTGATTSSRCLLLAIDNALTVFDNATYQ